MQLGLNSININTLTYMERTHLEFVKKQGFNPTYTSNVWKSGDITRMGNKILMI